MVRLVRMFAVVFLFLPAALAQQTNPTPQLKPRSAEPAKAPSSSESSRPQRLITLDVQVTDKHGAPIRGLQKQDFTLFDDKQPQNITLFHVVDSAASTPADPLVEVILVVDAVNTSFDGITYARSELKKFLLSNGGKLERPVSLVIFTDSATKVQDGSSRDGNALAALYDQYETEIRSINRSQGFYGAAERYDMSLNTIQSLTAQAKKRPGRKLMIWFSPGWPLLSGPNVQLSRKDEDRIFDSIVRASTEMREADITLYSIDPHGVSNAGQIRATYYEEFLKGVASSKQALPADLGLQVLAVQTGGRVFNVSNDLAAAIADCVADASYFYVISFNAALADQPNEYHSLTIRVDKSGTTARTRTGYYAQP